MGDGEIQRLCVFCGANPGNGPEFVAAAKALGTSLAVRNIGLVFGGGGTGLMGAVADAVLEAGGEATGVMPTSLVERELAHDGLTSLEIVDDMHIRKARMAELASGFIALPGGIGTLEELFEALTWTQLGFQNKRCGVLNVAGYYDSLLSFLHNADSKGFIHGDLGKFMVVESEPDVLIDALFDGVAS